MPPQDGVPEETPILTRNSWKRLCGSGLVNVGKLICWGNMSNMKSTWLNLIPNKVIVNCHMFYARMKDWIRTEIGGTKIVTIDNMRCRKSDAKLCEKWTNPIDFWSSSSNWSILNLCGWPSNCTLFLGWLRNWMTTKIDNIGTLRGIVIFVANPI